MIALLKKNLINIPGKKLQKKFLVFESDDWGTIRIPNKNVFNSLSAKKLISPNDPFSKFDTLESETDLSELFNVMLNFKDINGNNPVITANTVVCNPDFEKIQQHDFSEYYKKTFIETYKEYPNSIDSFDQFQKGINEKIFFPQFHVREHLNVSMWMNLLKEKHSGFLEAFQLNCFSIDYKHSKNRRNNLMAAYDYNTDEEFLKIKNSIVDGLHIFETIFNFKSESTIAPCYVWDESIEKVFLDNKVRFIQSARFQNIPIKNKDKFNRKFHYNGQKNNNNQYYLQRNGLFEPSLNQNIDWIDKCMESIEVAFKWGKPAVIGSHRLNFIGSIVPENREKNLKQLRQLLESILKKWPDVEFVSSVDLAKHYL